MEIRDRKGTENQVADHLSRLENGETAGKELSIKETFPDEQLFSMKQHEVPWYADYVNYIVSGKWTLEWTNQQWNKFFKEVKHYIWDEPYMFKRCADQLLRRCIPQEEVKSVLQHCHSSPYGGHFSGDKTAAKVLQSGLFWPTLFKDAYLFAFQCDRCQKTGNISRRNEGPLQNILEVEIFDVWGIDFMGPFIPSFGNLYILVAVDYVSK